MRILQVIPYFAQSRGGEVNVCLHLSKHLVDRGHEVTILTTDFELDQNRIRDVERLGIRLVVLECAANISLFLVSPKMANWLSENLFKYDIVHMHGLRSYQNIMASRLARRMEIPYILQAHGSVSPFLRKIALKKIYDLAWGRRILHNASRVIAITQREADEYSEAGVLKERITTIPNGIDLSDFACKQSPGQFKRRFSIRENEQIVLYVGRLHLSKGLDLLVSSFKKVADEIENARLVMVGPDEGYLVHLKKMVQSLDLERKVIITGFLSDDEMRSALSDADVFVTPMFRGFPITFLEAAASGVPIVTSTSGDRLDWLDKQAGFVVEFDATQMSNAITEILQNDSLRRKIGAQGIQIVRDNFDWRIVTKRVEELYHQAADSESSDSSERCDSRDIHSSAERKVVTLWRNGEIVETTKSNPHQRYNPTGVSILDAIPEIRVHTTIGNQLWASRGYDLLISSNSGSSWQKFCTLPVSPIKRLLSHIRFSTRLLRIGVHQIVQISQGKVLIACDKVFFVTDLNHMTLAPSNLRIRGFQVLDRSICEMQGEIVYGEYCPNFLRSRIRIFSSVNGIEWNVAFSLPPRKVKHLHLVQYDPYAKRIWFSTGDSDREVILGNTNEQFEDIKIIGEGNQIWRSLELVFEERKVYWGTDIPRRANWIVSYDRESGEIHKISEFPGPIYNLRRIGDYYIVVTAAEGKRQGFDNFARIWCSETLDPGNWKEIVHIRKDWCPMILGYGRLMTGANVGDSLYVWGSALNGADNHSLRIRLPGSQTSR